MMGFMRYITLLPGMFLAGSAAALAFRDSHYKPQYTTGYAALNLEMIMKRILDKSFHYRPSHETDIRKTFERVRRELRQQQEKATAKNVIPLELGSKQR